MTKRKNLPSQRHLLVLLKTVNRNDFAHLCLVISLSFFLKPVFPFGKVNSCQSFVREKVRMNERQLYWHIHLEVARVTAQNNRGGTRRTRYLWHSLSTYIYYISLFEIGNFLERTSQTLCSFQQFRGTDAIIIPNSLIIFANEVKYIFLICFGSIIKISWWNRRHATLWLWLQSISSGPTGDRSNLLSTSS